MHTWEMIKELTENPKKKFAVICGDTEEGTTVFVDHGEFTVKGCKRLFVSDEWEEVKQPVSFMEAVASGKRMKLVYEPFGNQIYRDLGDLLFNLSKECKTDTARDIIMNGKFHIED